MGAPIVVSGQIFAGKVGVAFSVTPALQDSDINVVESWQVTGLPGWASFNSVTGQITGTPNLKGGAAIQITATGPGGAGSAAASIMISEGQPILSLNQSFVGVVGSSMYGLIEGVDLINRPITSWVAQGLPLGVSLSSQGVLSGVPVDFGEYGSTITATGLGGSDSVNVSIKIFDAVGLKPRVWARQTVFALQVGQDFTYQLLASGFPDRWIINSILPTGIVFDSQKGILSGSGLLPGVWELQFFAKNEFGESDPLFLTFAIFQFGGASYYSKNAKINPSTWAVSFEDPVTGVPVASSGVRHGDLVTFRISFEPSSAALNNIISGKFSLKGMDTDAAFIVTENSDFYAITSMGSSAKEYYINVDFGNPALLSFLGDYEAEAGTRANCICEFEFISPKDPRVGGGINKITTLPFNINVFRDTI